MKETCFPTLRYSVADVTLLPGVIYQLSRLCSREKKHPHRIHIYLKCGKWPVRTQVHNPLQCCRLQKVVYHRGKVQQLSEPSFIIGMLKCAMSAILEHHKQGLNNKHCDKYIAIIFKLKHNLRSLSTNPQYLHISSQQSPQIIPENRINYTLKGKQYNYPLIYGLSLSSNDPNLDTSDSSTRPMFAHILCHFKPSR